MSRPRAILRAALACVRAALAALPPLGCPPLVRMAPAGIRAALAFARLASRLRLALLPLALLLLIALPGQAQAPLRPPGQLVITPNSIQDRSRPMQIQVAELARGETVYLRVLRDCDGDRWPDLKGRGDCRSPVWGPLEAKVEEYGALPPLDLKDTKAFPSGERFFLRVSRAPDGDRLYRDAVLEVSEGVCGLWQSSIDLFAGGKCDPGLLQILTNHQGPPELPFSTFEVRLIDPAVATREPATGAIPPGQAGRPVPGTVGATGVAWIDSSRMLVTLGRTPRDPEGRYRPEGEPTREDGFQPGLYRVTMPEMKLEMLHPAGEESTFTAPLALPDGGVAFVRHPAAPGGKERPAMLVWREGKPLEAVGLDRPLDRLLAVDRSGTRVVGLSLGRGNPSYLEVGLKGGAVVELGYHPSLYVATQRSSRGVAALDYEDVAGGNGWDIVLKDGQGMRAMRVGRGHDLRPAWRPDGADVAILAEGGGGGGRFWGGFKGGARGGLGWCWGRWGCSRRRPGGRGGRKRPARRRRGRRRRWRRTRSSGSPNGCGTCRSGGTGSGRRSSR